MAAGGTDDTLAGTATVEGSALPDGTELVAGRYRIVRWLGGGGMGRVYEAVDIELDERVALKVLRPGLSQAALHVARATRGRRGRRALRSVLARRDAGRARDRRAAVARGQRDRRRGRTGDERAARDGHDDDRHPAGVR